jgi:arylsulfatase B
MSLLLLLPPLLLLAAAAAAEAKVPPHIFLNVIDDLGHNDVPWSNATDVPAPKIKLLAESGVKLENYYVFRFCSPSRSTFMTGRLPYHIGQQTAMNLNPMPGIACGINLAYDFLPALLKKAPAPYTSFALGKWHLGFLNDSYTPTWRGFDSFLGYYSGAEEHFTHLKAGEGQNHFDLANSSGAGGVVQPCRGSVGPPLGDSMYSAWLYGNESIRLIERHHAEGSDSESDTNIRGGGGGGSSGSGGERGQGPPPLFMYIAWNNVHAPCEAPPMYTGPLQGKTSRIDFVGMMQALDDSMLAVVDTLRSLEMWSNSVWIFTTGALT